MGILHFLSLKDLSRDEILRIVRLSIEIKARRLAGQKIQPFFKDKVLGMIFEKSSTRTRVSFEVGAYELGGCAIFLSNRDLQLGRGETIADSARVISSMVDLVMIRTFSHEGLEEFARFSRVPVVNGLSDSFHPTQLVADYITMLECGIGVDDFAPPYAANGLPKPTRPPKVCYIGDGNNMAHSWLMLAAKLGFELRIATPKDYAVDSRILELARRFAEKSGAKIEISNDPKAAARGANVIATDTWISMGQEEEKGEKLKKFSGFCVDSALLGLGDEAIFLHCLPAYRGYEVSDEVMEGAQSRVFLEAENRLHAQKGIIAFLEEANGGKNRGK